MASRDAFGSFTFAAFSAQNIPVVVIVMINPSLIESSMLFPIKATHLFYKVFYHIPHAGKDINHANDVEVNNALPCFMPTNLRKILRQSWRLRWL